MIGIHGGPGVAVLNFGPRAGDVAGNLLMAGRAIAGAKRAHPSLEWIVLPELFTCGYTDLASVHRYAEDAGLGLSALFFSSLACSLDLHIAYGFPERLPGGGVGDAANLVGPEGVLLTYRKQHLVREAGEDRIFVAGSELPVVEAGGLGVALVICWDLGFPEVVREAALDGAELVLAPAGWKEPHGMQYQLSCAARALDNGVYLASANQSGVYRGARFETPGGVYGPDGRRVSEDDGFLSVSCVAPGAPERWRSRYGSTVGQHDAEPIPLEVCS